MRKILLNEYGIVLLSKDRCPTIKHELATKLTNFLVSKKGRNIY